MNIEPVEALRELRETIAFLVTLPHRLVESYFDTRELVYSRRERIERLKSLVEFREIGKALIKLYSAKGDLLELIRSAQRGENSVDPLEVKDDLQYLCTSLDELQSALELVSVTEQSVIIEVSLHIGRASRIYKSIIAVPDSQLLHLEHLANAYARIREMHESGLALVKAVDEQRKLLDHTYGD